LFACHTLLKNAKKYATPSMDVFRYETINFPNSNRPQQFRFRFVVTPQTREWQPRRILTRLASQMRRVIRQRLARVMYPRGRPNYRSIERTVRGVLTAQSLTTANVVVQRNYRGGTPENQSATTFNRLADLNFQALINVFEQMQQSNTEVDLPMIEWTFHINPSSIVTGGARTVQLKLKTAYEKTLKEWYDDQGIVF